MDMERRILFWNRGAEVILGYDARHVVGRQCYEALFGLPEQPSVPSCVDCLTVQLAESRRIAPVAQVRMRSASGERKRVGVMTLTIPGSGVDPSLLVHLFHELAPGPMVGGGPTAPSAVERHRANYSPLRRRAVEESLTSREVEVVRLLAAGEGVEEIAERFHLSTHTVLNHIRNARERVQAPTRAVLVLEAQRRGLL